MNEIDGLRSDAWLAQCERRARARRNRQVRMYLATVVVAFGLAATIAFVAQWWVTH